MAIDKSKLYFQAKTFSGNAGTNAITFGGSENMQPDFVWLKKRNGTANHHLVNSLIGAGRYLYLNLQNAEGGDGADGGGNDLLASFNSDGFTLDAGADSNASGATGIAWSWSAGGTAPAITYSVKVVSDSGNKYRFDDFGTSAVTLDLQEGGTYTFDQSDSSNSGHPLRFSTTSDGSHGGGSEFTTNVTTTGTPGNAGAKTVITLGSGVATLYYYCTQHSGMGGQANTNSTFGSSNFSGSIQSTVSAGTTQGFSIVAYTGTTGGASSTIGHGLGQTPDLVILKPRSYSGAWWWSQKDRSNKVLELQAGNAEVDPSTSFGGGGLKYSTFTSSVFGGTDGSSNDDLWNTSGATYIAYCYKSIKNFSKISTFVGNGSTDGSFLFCDFSPSFVMIKNASTSNKHWYIFDNKRSPRNEANIVLAGNYNNDESWWGTGNKIDWLSNGIKIRSNSDINNSGDTFVFMAFADSPFYTSTGIPTTAR